MGDAEPSPARRVLPLVEERRQLNVEGAAAFRKSFPGGSDVATDRVVVCNDCGRFQLRRVLRIAAEHPVLRASAKESVERGGVGNCLVEGVRRVVGVGLLDFEDTQAARPTLAMTRQDVDVARMPSPGRPYATTRSDRHRELIGHTGLGREEYRRVVAQVAVAKFLDQRGLHAALAVRQVALKCRRHLGRALEIAADLGMLPRESCLRRGPATGEVLLDVLGREHALATTLGEHDLAAFHAAHPNRERDAVARLLELRRVHVKRGGRSASDRVQERAKLSLPIDHAPGDLVELGHLLGRQGIAHLTNHVIDGLLSYTSHHSPSLLRSTPGKNSANRSPASLWIGTTWAGAMASTIRRRSGM